MVGGRVDASGWVTGCLQVIAAIGVIGGSASVAAAQSDDAQILYFEPLRLSSHSTTAQQKSTRVRELQFDAYGRHFVVSLEPNEKLSPLLRSKTGVAPVELYRGKINGATGSWARIAFTDGQPQGMLWDGSELYVIEPVAKLGESLPTDVPVSADTVAIFRLADVSMKPDAASCGTDTAGVEREKGSDAYDSLVSELKGATAIMQAAGATRRLQISALGDLLFLNRYGTEEQARTEILLRLNNVDGIFSQQLGIEIQVPTIDIGAALSDTTSPSSLLSELGSLRKDSASLRASGLTHLFTGRNLDGSTVGLAYVDSLCSRQYGVGLTEASSRSAWTESLIAAHEIGHNFGAPHDGEADKACASTASGQFLMSPSINGNDDFSACSLQVMQPRAAAASCITALPAADLTVAANLGQVRHQVGRSFDWNVTVSNIGGRIATDARAEIAVPSTLQVEAASVADGSCTSGAGTITCTLGSLAGGESAAITLTLRSDVVGSNRVAVDVSASNETQTSNNSGEATIAIEPEVDLSVTLQAPASVSNGSAFNVSLSATNASPNVARSVTVTVDLPAGVTASSATLNGAACSVQAAAITCSLDSLASGASVTGSASLVASTSGSAVFQARIDSSSVDPVAGNDSASATVSVASNATTSADKPTSSGGGGGSTSLSLLAALSALLVVKKVRSAARAR